MGAPGHPDVEDDHLAREVAQLEVLAMNILGRDFGDRLADGQDPEIDRCTSP
jgi:hypothetical protein